MLVPLIPSCKAVSGLVWFGAGLKWEYRDNLGLPNPVWLWTATFLVQTPPHSRSRRQQHVRIFSVSEFDQRFLFSPVRWAGQSRFVAFSSLRIISPPVIVSSILYKDATNSPQWSSFGSFSRNDRLGPLGRGKNSRPSIDSNAFDTDINSLIYLALLASCFAATRNAKNYHTMTFDSYKGHRTRGCITRWKPRDCWHGGTAMRLARGTEYSELAPE